MLVIQRQVYAKPRYGPMAGCVGGGILGLLATRFCRFFFEPIRKSYADWGEDPAEKQSKYIITYTVIDHVSG